MASKGDSGAAMSLIPGESIAEQPYVTFARRLQPDRAGDLPSMPTSPSSASRPNDDIHRNIYRGAVGSLGSVPSAAGPSGTWRSSVRYGPRTQEVRWGVRKGSSSHDPVKFAKQAPALPPSHRRFAEARRCSARSARTPKARLRAQSIDDRAASVPRRAKQLATLPRRPGWVFVG